MGRVLFGLFLVVPLIEIACFILIGQAIGLWPTLLGVVVMAIAGSLILRVQGLALVKQIQASMSRGELPARALADAMMVAIAGLLLISPGYFTDVIGLLLLIPPVRSAIYGYLKSRVKVVAATSSASYGHAPRQIDDETIELSDDEWRPR